MAKSVYIADVCKEIFAGGDVPKSALSYEKTAEYNVPIFSNGEKNCGLYGYTNNARVKEPSITVSARGTIGYTAIRTEPFVPVVRLITLTPKSEVIDLDYLFYATQNYKFEGSGTSIPQLTVPMLKKYKFPLPEMSHQKAIAVKFEKLDQLISLRKQQLTKLDELVKARFVEMFGDPIANPKQYKCYTVDDIIQFQGGSQPDKKFFEYEKTPDNIRLIQIRDYRTDKFATYIPTTMAKRFCTAEDIMIGRYGPPIFQILQGLEGSFNVALMKATPKRGNREFIRWFLKQDCLLHYLEGLSKRTAGQDGIQIDKLKAYPFPYPPDELQNEFATFVERVDQQKQTVQQSLEKLELMKKALMQEYFG